MYLTLSLVPPLDLSDKPLMFVTAGDTRALLLNLFQYHSQSPPHTDSCFLTLTLAFVNPRGLAQASHEPPLRFLDGHPSMRSCAILVATSQLPSLLLSQPKCGRGIMFLVVVLIDLKAIASYCWQARSLESPLHVCLWELCSTSGTLVLGELGKW